MEGHCLGFEGLLWGPHQVCGGFQIAFAVVVDLSDAALNSVIYDVVGRFKAGAGQNYVRRLGLDVEERLGSLVDGRTRAQPFERPKVDGRPGYQGRSHQDPNEDAQQQLPVVNHPADYELVD